MDNANRIIKPREREAVIRSLRSGVVPAVGLQYIQVGRAREVESFLHDIDTVAHGGASLRLVIGEYGAGKTFFLSLVRQLALERGLVTMHADLSPEKRLHGNAGQARRLLSDLVASLSTRTKRDGNGLPQLLERLAADPDTLRRALDSLRELPGGHAMATVVEKWCTADSEAVRTDALRWLSAGFTTRTDSLRALGLREYPGDADLQAMLRLYASLARSAGYRGLYVCIDEMVNLYKITNAVSRRANYEELLSMLNNILQGNIHGLGIVFSGTPEFLTDPRRGLYSYEALRSRLAENTLAAAAGLQDYDSTVLRLPNLTREELHVLLRNLMRVWGADAPDEELIEAYMGHCFERVGECYFRTPRGTIKGFLDLLSLLEQNPGASWRDILPTVSVDVDTEPSDLAPLSL